MFLLVFLLYPVTDEYPFDNSVSLFRRGDSARAADDGAGDRHEERALPEGGHVDDGRDRQAEAGVGEALPLGSFVPDGKRCLIL